MNARLTVLPILVVCAVFSGVNCGRGGGAANPVATDVRPPASATAPTDGGVDAAALTRQRWNIRDVCPHDRGGMLVRLWEARGTRLTGRVLRTVRLGILSNRTSFLLTCDSGTSTCLGATTTQNRNLSLGSQPVEGSGGSWGVGYNAENPRFNRSYCKACTKNPVGLDLTCSRAGREGQVVDDPLEDGQVGGGDEQVLVLED